MKNILLFLLAFSSTIKAHPHHHSLAVLDFNTETKQLELSLKLLTEDYSKLTEVEAYVNSHLVLTLTQERLTGKFEGVEIEPEFTWLFFTYEVSQNSIAGLKINNSMLLSLNQNQFNTVKLNYKKLNFSHNFSAHNQEYIFEIK